MSKSSKTGSLLCSDEITDRLNQRSIFCHGSWDPENIRGAAYDLRMAEDVLIVPDHSDSKSLQSIRYNRGEKRPNRVILKPGDVAFVSTMEHFCMPWDLSGMLGSKFSLTSQGVLMLTGVCIDPGYGLALQNGRWVPKDDERLHFLLANVGHDDVYLTPGKERIATIQFFKILAPAKKDSRIGGTEVAQKFFDPKTDQGGGLVFFRQMADVRQEVNELKQRIDEFGDRLSGIEAGSSQILLFGIYLLSATILGVSIAAILGIISNLKMELNSIGAYVLYVALGILGLIVIAIIYIATKFLQSKLFDNSKKSNRGVQ